VERARKYEPVAAMRGMDMNALMDRSTQMLERSGVLEAPARWWARASKRPEVRRGTAAARLAAAPALVRGR
jgi:hypothetical protein